MSVALLRFNTVMFQSLFSKLGEGYRWNIVFVLEKSLGSDVWNSTFSPSLS